MRTESGFTLVELVVALTIGAFVVFSAYAMFGAITTGAARAQRAGARLDQRMNGRRALAELVGSVDMTSPGAAEFIGEPARATFSAWTTRANGWPRLERVTLALCGNALCAGNDRARLQVLSDVDSIALDYLISPGASEAWVRGWRSPTSPPVAIRLRVAHDAGRDTLLLVVGPRG